jgi:hypothetical protein
MPRQSYFFNVMGVHLYTQVLEFLTHETTCTNEMAKRTTSEKFCQKTPPENGGTLAQATRGMCRLGQCRHHPAAVAKPGMWPWQHRR